MCLGKGVESGEMGELGDEILKGVLVNQAIDVCLSAYGF